MNEGISFLGNVGAASVGEFNTKIWFYQTRYLKVELPPWKDNVADIQGLAFGF